MDKTKLLVISALLGTAASSAFAYDGTVTFNGQLTDTTCAVNAADADKTVTLPTVATTALTAEGQTAGFTPFTISVSNCPASVTKVRAHFESNANMDSNTGNLVLTNTGGARNVQVQLQNTNGSQIALGGTNATSAAVELTDPVITATETVAGNTGRTAKMTYHAGYYATGATTAGAVTTLTNFTVAYN
ncbi:fimbrial protein [Serratia quinivorans]|uniref:fimbrial protein n=1 Tax=Serratia quinivorans TaxID=137545 RepID=UPI001C4531C4|nr:fimbrial protein [Serratia quinivorans]MBV6694014.1 type 1 fimbrial protein [Serratia quinivorans]